MALPPTFSGHFITARAAARVMVEQGSGVILALTSASSHGLAPMMGGTGLADAAAFLASDRAAGTTGTIFNVTCGMVVNP